MFNGVAKKEKENKSFKLNVVLVSFLVNLLKYLGLVSVFPNRPNVFFFLVGPFRVILENENLN